MIEFTAVSFSSNSLLKPHYVYQTYPRDSTKLPTNDQIINGLSRLRAAALPSAGCCAGLAPYVAANCPCLPGYQQLLPIGGFAPAYFEGATYILALACHLDFPLCHNAPISEQKSG